MYAISVLIDVDPARAEEYKAAALAHARNTMSREPGCLGFTVFQSRERPDRFYLHELYENRAAVEDVHRKAPYLAEFGRLTAPWVVNKSIEAWDSVE